MANLDSELRAAQAALNCAMGWRLAGKLLSMVTTWDGSSARLAQSSDKLLTWASVGMSPVTRSQKRPSGRGSPPPGARPGWALSAGADPKYVYPPPKAVSASGTPKVPLNCSFATTGNAPVAAGGTELPKRSLKQRGRPSSKAELEEKVDDNEVTFSVDDLDYDDATGRLFIHLESGVVEVNDSQARNQLLAQMS